MRRLAMPALFAVLPLVSLGGCSDKQPPKAGEPGPRELTPQGQLDAVQRILRPDPFESALLDSVVVEVHRLYYGPTVPVRGELHRLGPGKTQRYLLVASLWDSVSSAERVRFFVFEPGKPISAPSPMVIPDEIDRFAVDTIADFDNDNAADVGYCVWSGRRGTSGEWHAVGFRGTSWYTIAQDSMTKPCCKPQPQL